MRTAAIIALFICLASLGICQPDTSMAYVCQRRPLTAMRFGDGWYKSYTYEKLQDPKLPRVPKEIVDSGTYVVGRWTVTFKSKMGAPYVKRRKAGDIYGKPFDKNSKWRAAAVHLYPTPQEFEDWKKAYPQPEPRPDQTTVSQKPPKNEEKAKLYYDQALEKKKDAVKKVAEAWIRKYCPSYLVIIDSSYCGPGCYKKTVNGQSISWESDIKSVKFPNELNTIVHESVHMYNKSAFRSDPVRRHQHTHRYMIEPGMDVTVDQGIYYKTSEFISIVPKDAPDRIFRYRTYVGASSTVSANVWGIYGLLDEFSAYYNGTKASWDGYNQAKRMGMKVDEDIFRQETWETHYAWYEFRTFIGWYIQFAKTNHPDAYEDMMKNEGLKKVFREIDSRFKKLVDEAGAEGISYGVEYLSPLMEKVEPLLDEFKKEAPKNEAPKKESVKKKKK